MKQKNQLEVASIDINMAHVMGEANDFMKQTADINDRMQDVMLDQKEIQMKMAETNDIMNQIANNEENQAEEDDLFKELEQEVNKDKAQKISQQLNNPMPGVRVPAQMVQQQQQVRPQQMYQPSVVASGQKVNHMDDIERMLNSWFCVGWSLLDQHIRLAKGEIKLNGKCEGTSLRKIAAQDGKERTRGQRGVQHTADRSSFKE